MPFAQVLPDVETANVIPSLQTVTGSFSNNDTFSFDTETKKEIDWDTEAKIGLGCIIGGITLVTAFFYYLSNRNRQAAQANFKIIIKKTRSDSLGDTFIVPKLNLAEDFNAEDRLLIEEIGLRPYLKQRLFQCVQTKIENDESISVDLPIEKVIGVFLKNSSKKHYLDKHDMCIELNIMLPPNKKSCRFFAKILPPLIRSSMFFELSFGTIQNIGSLMLTAPILPISREANKYVAITQSVLSSLFVFLLSLFSPAQTFMYDLGLSFDKFFERHLFCKKSSKAEITVASWKEFNNVMSLLTKTILMFLLINCLYTGGVGDYQTNMSLKDRILNQNQMLPAWLVYTSSLIAFSLNQINDPVNLITAIFMAFKLIDIYCAQKQKEKFRQASVAQNDCHIEIVPNTQRLGFFSPQQSNHLSDPLLQDEKTMSLNPSP